MNPRNLLLAVGLATLGWWLSQPASAPLSAGEGPPPAALPGTWQGTPAPPAASLGARVTRFHVTNTGGGGGGFGRGDMHPHLASVDFWDRRTGWACGMGGVFKSLDGGLTWERVKPLGNWTIVRMAGPEEVWLASQAYVQGKGVHYLVRTTDGGKTWEDLKPRIPGMTSCLGLFCRGRERWLMGGMADGANFASADGGATWRRIDFQGLLVGGTHVAIPADVPTDAAGQLNGGFVAYVYGHRSVSNPVPLVKSTDGGRTWQRVPLPPEFPAGTIPRALYFASSTHGWLLSPAARSWPRPTAARRGNGATCPRTSR